MLEPSILILIGFTFLLAGLVKGVIGLGLPTVVLSLLVPTIGLHGAVAMLIIPTFATNVWQGLVGGNFISLITRFRFFILLSCLTTFFGGIILSGGDVALLSGFFGLLTMLYAWTGLARYNLPEPGPREGWMNPVFGAAAGLYMGLTGSYVVPGVMYLQATRLNRDELVQAMGIVFTLVTIVLGLTIGTRGLLTPTIAGISAAGIVPAVIGMVLGRYVRARITEDQFRKVFFIALLVVGAFLIYRNWLAPALS